MRDLILLSSLILVLLIVYVALKVNIRVRKARTAEIKKLNIAGYVKFLNNFKRGEEAEDRGNKQEAVQWFRRALVCLEEEENPDELVEETIVEVKNKIDDLEK